jgi:hypothetical protein
MADSNYTPVDDGFKPSSHLEALLFERHGDLHKCVVGQLNEPGVTLEDVADHLLVSTAWLSKWLKRNNYRRVTRWERN